MALILLPPIVRNFTMVGDVKSKSPIYGVYKVDTFSRNGQVEPAVYESSRCWQTVAVGNYAERLMVRTMNGSGRIS